MRRRPLNAVIEISVEIDDPPALIAAERDYYRRTGSAVDVDGMREEEALAVAALSLKQRRAHPRWIVPRQAIPDVGAAALAVVERALAEVGAMVESSATKVIAGGRRERDALGRRSQGATPARKRSRSR
jgi:hypothetical protein